MEQARHHFTTRDSIHQPGQPLPSGIPRYFVERSTQIAGLRRELAFPKSATSVVAH